MKSLPPSGVCAAALEAPASRSPVISTIKLVVFFIKCPRVGWEGKARVEVRERGVMVTRTARRMRALFLDDHNSVQIPNRFG